MKTINPPEKVKIFLMWSLLFWILIFFYGVLFSYCIQMLRRYPDSSMAGVAILICCMAAPQAWEITKWRYGSSIPEDSKRE